jgi:uncharacterized protein YyaL (SSP411 family)
MTILCTRNPYVSSGGVSPWKSTVPRSYWLGFGQWLQALAYALSGPREIAIVGDPDSADTQALLSVVREGYRPFQVVALVLSSSEPTAVPLLQDRGLVDGRATTYVCRDFTCQAPVTKAEGLRTVLEPH